MSDETLAETALAELAREETAAPAVHTWRWVFSGAAVAAFGAASATTHASVPFASFIDFGVHEFGHLVFAWAPWMVTAAAGSIFQVVVPLGFAAYFAFARKEYWAAAPLMAWAGNSARNVAVYIADAPYQYLDLWGGEGTLHDWAQLLQGRPMQSAEEIAWAVNALGWALIAGGLALVAWAAWAERRAVRDAEEAAAHAAAHEAELEARRATLPVREKHGPIG